jgi:3-isopropylmalate dehydratase small subunit
MKRAKREFEAVYADENAEYTKVYELNAEAFEPMVSRPGKPHDTVAIPLVKGIKIDSAFIGSCTNGRIEDMRATARVLEGKKVAPGVILKIVPATDDVWKQCLDEGLIDIFKKAGALVSNAGCAGCAAGQVGQSGPGEITISTGNRNFPGKQGKGDVYLASPSTVAASAIAGVITSADNIPEKAALPQIPLAPPGINTRAKRNTGEVKQKISGRCWIINEDNIDTDMIFHNRYLAITDINEMGQYTFDNLPGYENFAREARKGDIVFAGKNFGSGSSRQQAVDCFRALGIQAIVAESFGAIYERNAINAAFPLLSYSSLSELELKTGDEVSLDLKTGELVNNKNGKKTYINPFSEVQMDIYMNGGLL